MKITVVDFETTGVPTDEDKSHRVIEVGYSLVSIEGDDVIVDAPVSFLVNPKRPIPPESMAVHHITDAMVARDGITIEEAFRHLSGTSPDYWVAHNIDCEKAFFGGADIPWLCTYKTAVRVWPDAPGHSNNVLRYWLGLDLDPAYALPAHRAGPDAYVTAHLLREIVRNGSSDFPTMSRWSSGPALLPRLSFGKHKGLLYRDAPRDYLEWIAHKSDLGKDEKATARYWLKNLS